MAGRRRAKAAVLATALSITPAAAAAAELRVNVAGLRSGDGDVHYALYDKAEGFPTQRGKIAGDSVKAAAPGVVIVLGGLVPGRYAVAVYHDENGNGRFDQGIFGIPLEDYGFSNDASAWFAPPPFADAAVTVDGATTEITIRLR